jgi:hypothetical protein
MLRERAMAKRAGWFARVFGFDGTSHGDDGFATFERVDGSRLGAHEFHQSDSMRLDDARLPDFTETLPAYSHRATPLTARATRMASQRPHAAGSRSL